MTGSPVSEAPGILPREPSPPSLGGASGAGVSGDGAFPWIEVERATSSPTLSGNEIRLQFEGSNTFDSWLEAIASARRFVYFENYVVRDDRVGRAFRDALIAKMKAAQSEAELRAADEYARTLEWGKIDTTNLSDMFEARLSEFHAAGPSFDDVPM